MCTAKATLESLTMSDTAKNAILEQLSLRPYRPIELLESLGNQFSDFEVKEAVLRLLQEGTVVMTSDRRLRLEEAA